MSVKQQILEILRSNETHRIRFSFQGTGGRVTVDHTSFNRVATAIASDQIQIVEGRFTRDIAVYSSWADPAEGFAANTLYLGRNPRSSRLFNALIVHECVHAAFDLARASLPWVDNEAAGYIAQAYYARNSGLPRMAYNYGDHAFIAYSIVTNMRADSQSDVDYFLTALRDSLNADPMYHRNMGTQYTGNG
jgi:hypothetical protein